MVELIDSPNMVDSLKTADLKKDKMDKQLDSDFDLD